MLLCAPVAEYYRENWSEGCKNKMVCLQNGMFETYQS